MSREGVVDTRGGTDRTFTVGTGVLKLIKQTVRRTKHEIKDSWISVIGHLLIFKMCPVTNEDRE